MRQIDLTVPSHRTDDMLVTKPIKQPLMTLGLRNDLEMKGNPIKDTTQIVMPPDDGSVDGERIGATEESFRSSPRASRSRSLNSYDTKVNTPNTKPGYERKLLKKYLLVPDISIDIPSSDEYGLDEETRAKILDYRSDVEQPGTIHKPSFNDKFKLFAKEGKEKTSTMKKLIKSPSLLKKTYSFKNNDSNVSSSAETTTNDTEKRKKRKISIGKRRKSSKYQEATNPVEQDVKVEKPERSTKFRRKKLIKSQSESSLTSLNVNKSKLILLYSGDSPAKHDRINRKNRLGLLKHKDSLESSSEYDEYSSALSDGENLMHSSNELKPRRLRRGVAKRVWKSINSLFMTDDQSPPKSSLFNTPPSLRRHTTKCYSKSSSMPGGLNRVKSFSGLRSNVSKGCEQKVKDDLSMLRKKMSMEEGRSATRATNKKMQRSKLLRGALNGSSVSRRSRSLDYLFDTPRSVRRRDLSNVDWFEPRKKIYSTKKPNEPMKETVKHGLQYKIIVFQEPQKVQRHKDLSKEITKDADPSASSNKDNNNNDNHSNDNKPRTKAKDHRQEYIKIRFQDLKANSQKEMERYLSSKRFQPGDVNDWCRTLSESIKDRIVKITGETHKVVAQVFIGALCDDGIHAAIQCTRKSEKSDSFFTVTYKGTDLFAVASVLAFEL